MVARDFNAIEDHRQSTTTPERSIAIIKKTIQPMMDSTGELLGGFLREAAFPERALSRYTPINPNFG